MIASLPMYDWPEVQLYNDQLWNSIRTKLKTVCHNAPEKLSRASDTADSFLFSQTCGLPLVTQLPENTVVLGTPHYAVDYCKAGFYASVIVVRSTDHRRSLDAYRSAAVAVNSTDSQSGYNAVKNLLISDGLVTNKDTRFFKQLCVSGSHRQSIRLVADGTADICAIDPVSWRLAQQHEPAAQQLKVITHTPYTPGLPLITSANAIPNNVTIERWQQLCREAFRLAIDRSITQHLHICDIEYIDRTSYEAVPIRHFAL